MKTTTSINPGAFRTAHQLGPIAIVRGSLSRLRRAGFRASINYLRCQSSNWIASRGTDLRYYCNVCETEVPRFVHLSNELAITWSSACPNCDSRKRHRGLSLLYKRIFAEFPKGFKLLHFAPEPILFPLIEASECDYKTTDFFLEDVDYPGEDVQKLTYADGLFDCVLSNHVVEHVEDDASAFKEMHRILAPGGIVVITIPGNWRRQETVTFSDLSHNGHFRDYGLDVVEKLEGSFQEVEVVDLYDEAGNEAERLSINPKHDIAFVCRK
ncbi:MAG: hypothetical protein ACI9R3_002156 [Verrucomicrobiales bacterium]|jgi:hypothetical protein